MSKNHARYKEDYTHLNEEFLDEVETEKFEKFHPKKDGVKNKSNVKQKSQKQTDE
jgi:hypothetical protein